MRNKTRCLISTNSIIIRIPNWDNNFFFGVRVYAYVCICALSALFLTDIFNKFHQHIDWRLIPWWIMNNRKSIKLTIDCLWNLERKIDFLSFALLQSLLSLTILNWLLHTFVCCSYSRLIPKSKFSFNWDICR